MNKSPIDIKVSVIVPNYNHNKYLQERIESILEQTFTDYEIILLDDCSKDDSKNTLYSFQNNPHVTHIIINKENTGSPFIQWEKGIKLAQGEYIWIAESDDFASPFFLQETVKALESNPNAALCYTGSYIVNSSGELLEKEDLDRWREDGLSYIFKSEEYIKSHLLYYNSIYNASMVLFRKENCLLNITQKYKSMHYAGDWLFWIEQCQKGDVIEVRKKLNYYRKHDTNTTLKGDKNGNVIAEIAYIKGLLHRSIHLNWTERIIDKSILYRQIKYYPVSKQRRKELYKIANQQIKITYLYYVIGQRVKSYIKHQNKNKRR